MKVMAINIPCECRLVVLKRYEKDGNGKCDTLELSPAALSLSRTLLDITMLRAKLLSRFYDQPTILGVIADRLILSL